MTGLTVTPPTKTVYAAGEELDTTGMKVEAKYSDNTTKELTEEEYMLSGFDSSKAGTITVTISQKRTGLCVSILLCSSVWISDS